MPGGKSHGLSIEKQGHYTSVPVAAPPTQMRTRLKHVPALLLAELGTPLLAEWAR